MDEEGGIYNIRRGNSGIYIYIRTPVATEFYIRA